MKKIILALMVSVSALVHGLGEASINITPSFGPMPRAASFAGYVASAINSIKSSGTLPSGERNPSDAFFTQSLVPEDFMYSPSVAFYRGVFSPAVPWNNEVGGTVWWWLDISAINGGTISLADVTVVLSSSEPFNSLGKTETFGSKSYSPGAIGIKSDGTVIDSGAASQQVHRVIVGVASKTYNVNNAADVQEVRDYINGYSNWKTTCTASVSGTSGVKTLSTTPITEGQKPKLSVTIGVDKTIQVTAQNNQNPLLYALQFGLSVNGPFQDFAVISSGGMVTVPSVAPMAFVRYKP